MFPLPKNNVSRIFWELKIGFYFVQKCGEKCVEQHGGGSALLQCSGLHVAFCGRREAACGALSVIAREKGCQSHPTHRTHTDSDTRMRIITQTDSDAGHFPQTSHAVRTLPRLTSLACSACLTLTTGTEDIWSLPMNYWFSARVPLWFIRDVCNNVFPELGDEE